MIDRRRFIIATIFGAVGATPLVQAQQGAKVWRIGYLTPTEVPPTVRELLIAALGQLGYVQGKTLILEIRTAEDNSGHGDG